MTGEAQAQVAQQAAAPAGGNQQQPAAVSAPMTPGMNVSKFWNMIKAIIDALIKRLTSYLNGPELEKCRAWVKANRELLLNLTFEGTHVVKDVLPYADQKDIKLPEFDNARDSIEHLARDLKSTLEGETNFDKWRDSLYKVTGPAAEAFLNSTKNKENEAEAKKKYMNSIVFPGKTGNITAVNISGADINTALKNWVAVVEGSAGIVKPITDQLTAIQGAMTKLQTAVTNLERDQKANQPKPAQGAEAPKPTGVSPTTALTSIQSFFNNVIKPVGDIVIGCIQNQYKYIQQAYQIGQKPQQTAAQQPNTTGSAAI
jgi:hypothetical protein